MLRTMGLDEQLRSAESFIDEHFPQAEVAVVAGSTARGSRTPTSDIDLLLIGPPAMFEDGSASLAATYDHRGEVIELFAYTVDAFTQWAELGVRESRPVIVDMLVSGIALRNAGLTELREHWGPILDAGPTPSRAQLAQLRYAATDLLDDLADATDPLERSVIAHNLVERLATLLLLVNGQWTGNGKYLVRRLRIWDPSVADQLGAPLIAGDHRALVGAATELLNSVGGRLQAGHVR